MAVTNAAVFAAAGFVLAVSPLTVSFPIAPAEAVALLAGMLTVVGLNFLLVRRAFDPLVRLTAIMPGLEPGQDGQRVPDLGGQAEILELRRAFNAMLDRLYEERRVTVRRSLAAQEGERHRIAAELHDEVGQSLTAIMITLDRADRRPAQIREGLAEARETARRTLDDVRRIVRDLRPEALDDLGLERALETLSDRVASHTGMAVDLSLEEGLPPLDEDAELVIYRVAQEAMTNAVRHGNPSHLTVTMACEGPDVVLEVSDDGRGFSGLRPGNGIQGMRERALLVGGRLQLGPRSGGGTELRLAVPRRAYA